MKKLKSPALTPFGYGQVVPEGWLRRQLRIQADGLSGNLDLFWNDIQNSRWIGGTGESWERLPYWLDGFIPLAFLLEDEQLKSRARGHVEAILNNQREDGWICPEDGRAREQYDIWPMFLILKVLTVWHSATGDDRVQGVVHRALRALDRHIDGSLLFGWAQTRWYECLIPLFWLYERAPERWLWNLANKIASQGFDWQGFYRQWPYRKPEEHGRWSQMSHVVNNAMMLKSGALRWRMSGLAADMASPRRMFDLLERYHGLIHGMFSGDECLSGRSPVQGTELCAVAEFLYSAQQLLSVTGDAFWGDRLERVAYNALPAAFSPDMWTHQYDQQPNQVQCSTMECPPFRTNGGQANLFGLEPNYGCCTANLSQAWPKFAASVFMKSEDGIAVALYAPASVSCRIGGNRVDAALLTDYPFRERIVLRIKSESKSEFSLHLRIPQWAREPRIQIEGKTIRVDGGRFYTLRRCWEGTTEITLCFPMEGRLRETVGGLAAVERGPLVYALPVGERWEKINNNLPGHEFPHCDYEVYPESEWRYGLVRGAELRFEERPDNGVPFSPGGAPVVCRTEGRRVEWELRDGCAAPLPGPAIGEPESLTLIPYGCTNLRLTEMPVV